MDLRGKVAAITGGASGLGAATARAVAQAGGHAAILDLDRERGQALATEIGGSYHALDVTDAAACADAVDAVAREEGGLHLAVTCAGIAPAARVVGRDGAPHDADLFARVIAVNLLGSFNAAAAAAAVMARGTPQGADAERGVIVLTASVAAYEGQVGQAAYAASKGGVAGLVLPMARELAGRGIRVAAVAPGLFLTPMLEGLPPEVQESLGAQVPFPARLGRPDEFARLVLAIAANPMMNGSVTRLDGAIRMQPR
jgi:NAD(P)-dependent dehydrogenase (short-subunit alcohol dehydrogenase family)